MVDPQIQDRINKRLLEVLENVRPLFNTPLQIPEVKYKQMGRCAGRVKSSQWEIILNPDYLFNGHLEDMINQTLPHELAHLLANRYYQSHGHDRYWKLIMAYLGLEPRRCHDYSQKGVKCRNFRKVMAKCPTCGLEFKITLRRMNQIRSGVRIWHSEPLCRRVKACLVIVGEEPMKVNPVNDSSTSLQPTLI